MRAFSSYETDLAAAHERALAQRPEVIEARLKVNQAEYERRIKKSESKRPCLRLGTMAHIWPSDHVMVFVETTRRSHV